MVVVVAEFQYAKAMASMNTPTIANNHSGARNVRRRRVSDGDSGGDSRESFMWAG